jgi:drug/metabolite transporter (DMT)-like permease
VLAYIGSWFFSRKLLADSVLDELLLVLAGLTGCSLYFWTENNALLYSTTSNVALLLAATPIITALVTKLFYPSDRLEKKLIVGSIISLIGSFIIIYNGASILELNPKGDFLALSAAFMWAFYSVILKRFEGRYSTWFITRKVFFYGLVTLIPFMLFDRDSIFIEPSAIGLLIQPKIFLNLTFLGLVASMVCYYTWNYVLEHLGVVKVTNYLYLQPIITLICAVTILDERITLVALGGALLILLGLVISEKK